MNILYYFRIRKMETRENPQHSTYNFRGIESYITEFLFKRFLWKKDCYVDHNVSFLSTFTLIIEEPRLDFDIMVFEFLK